MRHNAVAASAALLLLASLSRSWAQDPTLKKHSPDITVTSQLVVLNVSIHDKDGRPIHGLTPANFDLLDDNQQQHITSVEEHSATQPADAFHLPTLPSNIYSNIPSSPINDALNVLLIDAEDLRLADQSRIYQQLTRFAQEMPLGARVALMVNGTHLEIVCGFTTDHARMAECLHSHHAWPITPIPTANINAQYDIFSALSDYLSQFPGRKNVIWITSHLPGSDPFSFEQPALTDMVLEAQARKRNPAPTNDIVVYPISPDGPRVPAGFTASGRGGFDVEAGLNSNVRANLRTTEMGVVAHDTGGKAFYGSNDLAKNMVDAIADGSNYYTIAYTPTNFRYGKFHHVDIAVRHSPTPAKTNYRPGYLAVKLTTAATYTQEHPLPPDFAHGAPDTLQILFRARVQPTPVQPDLSVMTNRVGQGAAELKRPVRYSVDWAADTRGITPQTAPDGGKSTSAVLSAVIYDADGKLLNFVNNAVGNPFEAAQSAGLQYHQFIDIPEGDVYIRLTILDPVGHTGSAEFPLKVVAPPDPATASLTSAKSR
jgi:VWFA-related protein